jgi:hypothetical protein
VLQTPCEQLKNGPVQIEVYHPKTSRYFTIDQSRGAEQLT